MRAEKLDVFDLKLQTRLTCEREIIPINEIKQRRENVLIEETAA